ncbi:MAG: YeeE/YedE family protein [Arenicellales bacterium]|nr:YeeE/YedE family protein [Arenicellales bacterium]
MEFEVAQRVALYGFLAAMLFGAVAHRTHFCTMGSISDWINIGTKNRFRTWMLAIAIAMVGTQTMAALGWIDINEAFYLTSNFGWAGYIVGGLIFGIGMTIGSGCGQRSLVRAGAGNLKSVVVLLVMGITAYTTSRGLFAPVRVELSEQTAIDLTKHGFTDQGIGTLLAGLIGGDAGTLSVVLTALIAMGAVLFAFTDRTYRKDFDNILAAVALGGLVAGGWYITGVIGKDDFEPVPLESVSIISPTGNTINYIMTYTGATINFGIAVVLGIIAGSFIYAIASKTFRIETFASRADLINHMLAGFMMGFGGLLASGCTIGQGVTGVSTLALGSFMALASIIAGSAFTIKMQYHMLDVGFGEALYQTFADFKLLPQRQL